MIDSTINNRVKDRLQIIENMTFDETDRSEKILATHYSFNNQDSISLIHYNKAFALTEGKNKRYWFVMEVIDQFSKKQSTHEQLITIIDNLEDAKVIQKAQKYLLLKAEHFLRIEEYNKAFDILYDEDRNYDVLSIVIPLSCQLELWHIIREHLDPFSFFAEKENLQKCIELIDLLPMPEEGSTKYENRIFVQDKINSQL